MKITMIAAVSENNVIGNQGSLPWNLQDDLRWFRLVTEGKTVVMGRKTYESIGGALPDRNNIVITRGDIFRPVKNRNFWVVDNINDLVYDSYGVRELIVIGGGEIYKQFLDKADMLHITRVHTEVEGDTYFPEIDPYEWSVVSAVPYKKDERNDHDFTIVTYERVS